MTAEGAFPLTASRPERKVKTEEQTRYRERTPWASWVDLIYCGAIVSCAYSVFVTSGGGILFGWPWSRPSSPPGGACAWCWAG